MAVITVAVPCYNEEEVLPDSAEKLRALRKLYPDMPYQYGVEE